MLTTELDVLMLVLVLTYAIPAPSQVIELDANYRSRIIRCNFKRTDLPVSMRSESKTDVQQEGCCDDLKTRYKRWRGYQRRLRRRMQQLDFQWTR